MPALAAGGLLDRHRHPGRHLLGAGQRPEPRRRLRRAARDRLRGAAHLGRLYRQRPGRAGRGPARPRPPRRRRRRRRRRRLPGPPGAAPADLLLRHDHPRLRDHRHADRAGLDRSDRRRHRPPRARLRAALRWPGRLLPSLRRHRRPLHLDDAERGRQPLRPQPGRLARRRGRRRGLRRSQGLAPASGVPHQRRPGRRRRCAVRQPAELHHSRRLHLRPVRPVLHRHPHRRTRQRARPLARHPAADGPAGDRGPAGRLVDLPLRGAAAADRPPRPRRHRRPARRRQPPAAPPPAARSCPP